MDRTLNKKGSGLALVPFLVFVVIYLGAGLILQSQGVEMAFYQFPSVTAMFIALLVAFAMTKGNINERFRIFAKGGRENTGMEAIDWIRRCVDAGAGEVVVNSIDTDGVKNGFDWQLLDAVAARCAVPIIASGGAGKKEDFRELFVNHPAVDAGLAASIFHTKQLEIRELKQYLRQNGVEVRL